MAKRDMNDLLKRRMSATQQAAEVTVGDEAYEVLIPRQAGIVRLKIL